MATAVGDLDRALFTAWTNSGLNPIFRQYWTSNQTEFPVLSDQEAPAAQPFPYCVIEKGPGTTTGKMSGLTSATRQEIRRSPVTFSIHARSHQGTPKTAKLLAIELAEEVMKVFGGHPTQIATDVVVDNGAVLVATFIEEHGIRTGDDEYQWILKYEFSIDIPVAT